MATKNRVFRIADDLYDPARAAAAEHDDTLTDVVRLALAGYVESAKSGTDGAAKFMQALRDTATEPSSADRQFA